MCVPFLSLHYFQCNRIKFNLFLSITVFHDILKQIQQRLRIGKIFARWHLAIAITSINEKFDFWTKSWKNANFLSMLKCHFNALNKKPPFETRTSSIVGCIYRHPSSNLGNYISQLENLVSPLNQSKHQVFILGDMNIGFLRVGKHSKTEDYLDMLYSSNLLPVITKPTRITSHTATLIDHIQTQMPLLTKSYLVL